MPNARPATTDDEPPTTGGSGTFDLLGFTLYWGRFLKGNWVVRRKTAKGRLSRALKAVHRWCKTHRHRSLAEQQRTLIQQMMGHYAYYFIMIPQPATVFLLGAAGPLVRRRRTWT